MGQYYLIANLDKKEYMISDGFFKLMEWSYRDNNLILNLENMLANEWKGDQVYVLGDYAQSGNVLNHNDVLLEIESKLNCLDEAPYDFIRIDFKRRYLKDNLDKYRYFVNHSTKEFVDFNHCPLDTQYELCDLKGLQNYTTIAPSSLLLALGNGLGGGDYRGNNEDMVGLWAKDVKSLEITNELPKSYKEFMPEFYEGVYVPYKMLEPYLKKGNKKSRQEREFDDRR